MADLKYTIEVGVQQALRAMDDLNKKLQKASDDFDEFNGKIAGFGAAIAATLIAAGIAAGRFADQLNDTAAAFDTTTNNVLGLGQALTLAGGKFDSVGRLYDTFARSIQTANEGNLKSIDTFDKLGISVRDLGKLSQEELQQKTLAALSKIPDAAQRNALAVQLFGKALQGVDIPTFSAQIIKQREEFAKYADQVKLAGDAYGKLDDMLTNLRVAAAVAFEPIFKAIKNLNITTEDLIKGFKILTAVMIGLGSAAVIGPIGKATKALALLGSVVSKNKLVTIIGALVSIGAATATWLGLSEDNVEATDDIDKKLADINGTTKDINRDQSAVTEQFKKQRDTLNDVTEAFDRQLRSAQKRLDLELAAVGASEQQKKISSEQARIEEQTQAALASLKSKYDALDEYSRKQRLGDYERERAAIIANGEAAKQSAEITIRAIREQTNALEEYQRSRQALVDLYQKAFELEAQLAGVGATATERATLENKINQVVAERTALLEAAGRAGLDPAVLSDVKRAIGDVTTDAELLRKHFVDISPAIDANLAARLRALGLTEAQMRAIIDVSQRERAVISASAELQDELGKIIRDKQRDFVTGWKEAFNQYVDDATNAARQAESIFRRVTQGLEDAFVNFAKTGRLSFRSMINGIVEDLLRSQIRQLLANIFGSAGQQGGNIFGSIGKIFGFAGGGVVPGNRPIMVGEQGPEIFMPPGQGTIIPNNQLGTGATSVVYNINAVDAQSFKQMVARDPAFLYAVTEQGRRTIPGAA